MQIPLLGGPYDGRKIAAGDIMNHLRVLVLKVQDGTRKFIYLPDPDDWPALLGGQVTVAESKSLHFYELESTPRGPRLVFDPRHEHYWGALDQLARQGGGGS